MIWYVVAADEQRKPISIYLPDGPATERLEAIVRYPFGCNVSIIAQVS
jgi:hypothetical protein